MSRLKRMITFVALVLFNICFAEAATTSGATASVRPTTGISASGVASLTCPSSLWSCLTDPIGYPDGDTGHIYTTSSSGSHVIGFSGPYAQITSVTMHIVAASYNSGSGTVTMNFYNGSQLAGQGAQKTISAGSGYQEYVSGVFYTAISNLSDITMHISLTGSVKYTAVWLDITYGPAGTPNTDLENYLIATGGNSSDYPWDKIYANNIWIGGSCTSVGCAGGVGTTAPDVTRNAASPSRNGDTSATKIVASAPSGSGTASLLEWVKMNAGETTIPPLTPNPTSVTGDWWVYVSNASTNNPRTLEFDLYWGNGTNTAMWGTHCSLHDSAGSGQVWYLDAQDLPTSESNLEWQPAIDAQTNQAIPCSLTPGQWHHITWQVHQDPSAEDANGSPVGRIFYDYLTVDGTTHVLTGASKTRGYKYYTKQQFDTLGIQVQQDLNLSSSALVSITEYVDAMSFTYW